MDVDASVGESRRRPRSVIKGRPVPKFHGVSECPVPAARGGIETLNVEFVFEAMTLNEASFGKDRTRVSFAHIKLPNDAGTRCRPVRGEGRAVVDGVARWAEKLRPVGGEEWTGAQGDD